MSLLTPFLKNVIHANRGIPDFHVTREIIDESYKRARENTSVIYGGTKFDEDDAIELIAASILMSDMTDADIAITAATLAVKHFGAIPPDTTLGIVSKLYNQIRARGMNT